MKKRGMKTKGVSYEAGRKSKKLLEFLEAGEEE